MISPHNELIKIAAARVVQKEQEKVATSWLRGLLTTGITGLLAYSLAQAFPEQWDSIKNWFSENIRPIEEVRAEQESQQSIDPQNRAWVDGERRRYISPRTRAAFENLNRRPMTRGSTPMINPSGLNDLLGRANMPGRELPRSIQDYLSSINNAGGGNNAI